MRNLRMRQSLKREYWKALKREEQEDRKGSMLLTKKLKMGMSRISKEIGIGIMSQHLPKN